MKTNRFIKLISLLLSVVIFLSFASCDSFGQNQPEQTEAQTQPNASRPTTFVPDADYAIVYGALYSADQTTANACKYLRKALEAAYGLTVSIVDDSTEVNAKKEFLVGITNRDASKQIADTLALNDYAYSVVSDESIVICGAIPEQTYTAVKKFCEDILTYDGTTVQTANPEINLRAKYAFYDEYEYDLLMINGILWEDYTLAITTEKDMHGAIQINKQFGQYTGRVLPIVHASELTGAEESIFRVGAAYRNGTASDTLSGYLINTYKDDAGNVFCLEATANAYYEKALEEIVSRAGQEIEGTNLSYTIGHETVSRINLSSTKSEYTHWTLAEETTETLSEGITYTEQLYYGATGLPYRVYTVVVDTKINKIAMGCSNDGYDFTVAEEDRQTTKEHMQAAVKNGKNVIAAINGDFFNNREVVGDYRPWGFTVKDGKLISKGSLSNRPKLTDDNIRPFFGFTKDGQPLIAMESEYQSNEMIETLETAVGGAWILAQDGKTIYNKNQGTVTHGGVHPRGLVGYREDGTVVLMVIDGRQPEHSNGASLLQCSLLMQRFGTSDALLLDGGGSSCMVLRNPYTNQYTTANKPSDKDSQGNNKLREIYNSLLVIKK